MSSLVIQRFDYKDKEYAFLIIRMVESPYKSWTTMLKVVGEGIVSVKDALFTQNMSNKAIFIKKKCNISIFRRLMGAQGLSCSNGGWSSLTT